MSEAQPRYVKMLPVSSAGVRKQIDACRDDEAFALARLWVFTPVIPLPAWGRRWGLDAHDPHLTKALVLYVRESDSPITRPPEADENARILCADPSGVAIVGLFEDPYGIQGGGTMVGVTLYRAAIGPDGYAAIHRAWRARMIDDTVNEAIHRAQVIAGCDAGAISDRSEACLLAAGVDDATWKARVDSVLLAHGLDPANRARLREKALTDAGLNPVQAQAARDAIAQDNREDVRARLRIDRPDLFERLE